MDAPFFSPEQLTGMPGDAALSGVAVNFDPANKAPLQSLESTFNRLDSENAQALAQKRQQAFQREQQDREFQNDVLRKTLDAENRRREDEYKQNILDRNELYKGLQQRRDSVFNQKDANGNDMSFAPVAGDDAILNASADALTKNLTLADYTSAMSNPEFRGKIAKHEEMTRIAGIKAAQVAAIRQRLANTGDPVEQAQLKNTIDKTLAVDITKGELPDVHYPGPRIGSLLGENSKDYPQGKGFESTDAADGETYMHRPYADFSMLRYNNNDRDLLNKQYMLAADLSKQPQFTDPVLFQQYQNEVNARWAGEGKQTPFKLGVVKDGKVVLNPDPREITAAAEFMSKGGKVKYADSEKDAADLDYKKAQAEHLRMENKATQSGKAKGLTPTDIANQQAAEATIKRLRPIFDAKNYPGKGTPIGDKKFDGVNVKELFKDRGLDPSDWGVYKPASWVDAEDIVGKERIVDKGDGKGEQRTGETDRADKKFMFKNNKTGDIRIGFFKEDGADKDGYKKYVMQSFVNGREAVGNAAKHKHQYKVENSALSEEINRNEAAWDEANKSGRSGMRQSFSPKYNGSDVPVRKNGGILEANINGAWKKIKSRNSQTGEIKVE